MVNVTHFGKSLNRFKFCNRKFENTSKSGITQSGKLCKTDALIEKAMPTAVNYALFNEAS